MAYLYPTIKNAIVFLAKRYLRIMPIFAVVVLYIWFTMKPPWPLSTFGQLVVLLAIALITRLGWLILASIQRKFNWVGLAFFGLFVVFQFVLIFLGVFADSGFLAARLANLDQGAKSFLEMLSNLSMTMYWNKRLVMLDGVYWSLVPEMIFYTLYPVVAVPVIALINKRDWKFSLVLAVCIILVLFGLDEASRSFFSWHGAYFSRASGFVVGVWLGTIYRNQGLGWLKWEKFAEKKWLGPLVLAVFLWAMALEWPDRFHQIRFYVMQHFLLLSLIFTLVVSVAISAGSWLNKVFSHPWLVFLGKISFSLYLIHPQVIRRLTWSQPLIFLEKTLVNMPGLFATIRAIVLASASIFVAYLLYVLVESLYFAGKTKKLKEKNIKNTDDSSKSIDESRRAVSIMLKTGGLNSQEDAQSVTRPKGFTWLKIWGPAILLCLLLTMVYAGDFSPTLVMVRHNLPRVVPGELLVKSNQPLSFSFTSNQPNLSVVMLTMDYAREPSAIRTAETQEVQLVFRLYDSDDNLIIESKRQPVELEGVLRFPFGFPTISDSADKQYKFELSLLNPDQSDEVYLYPDQGVITQHTPTNSGLAWLTKSAALRLVYAWSYPQLWFSCLVVLLVAFSITKLESTELKTT